MVPCQKAGMCLTGASLDLIGCAVSADLPDDGRGETCIRSADGSARERLPALRRTQNQIQSRLETE